MSLASLIALDLPFGRVWPLNTGAGLAALAGKADLFWDTGVIIPPGPSTAGALPSLIAMDLAFGLLPVGLTGEPFLRQLLHKYAFGIGVIVPPELGGIGTYIPTWRRRRR